MAGGTTAPTLDEVLKTVLGVLDDMGVEGATDDAILVAPPFYPEPVLLQGSGRFTDFSMRLVLSLEFVPYAFDDVALLSVRDFCRMYLRDSHPPLPESPLDAGAALVPGPAGRMDGDRQDQRICFILGAGRSGTTLLRAMLNRHSGLWAPGELHLANFATMADRADRVIPTIRFMPLPELAERCDVPLAEFARRFRRWEIDATPTGEIYRVLHEARPDQMIVDKTPPYSVHRETLDRIGAIFPNATFVQLMRNPHDVIRSYVRMQFHRGDRRAVAERANPHHMGEAIWCACTENAAGFLDGIEPSRKRTIRYEDLTADPARELGVVCQMLGIDLEPGMVDPYAGGRGPGAMGAGDPIIHLMGKVSSREPAQPFYPVSDRCDALARRYGYVGRG